MWSVHITVKAYYPESVKITNGDASLPQPRTKEKREKKKKRQQEIKILTFQDLVSVYHSMRKLVFGVCVRVDLKRGIFGICMCGDAVSK
jgi:hypothetical protein